MTNILGYVSQLNNYFSILRTIIIVVLVYVTINLFLNFIEKNLLKRAKTKKHRSNVEIFTKIVRYVLLLILVLFAIFSYSGSWTGLGLTVGLLSAALGWALQKPITGIAAWIMIVTKRPFEIGDRIIIDTIKGDVTDITLTHVYINEVGGIVGGEELSGRIIMVPNAVLFEKNIVNYTSRDEYVLDQVVVAVTYESNLDKAIKIALESAKKYVKEFKDLKEKPYVRTYFQPSGINIHVRYFSPATRMQEISSNITKEIYGCMMKTKGVEIAYPHTEVVFRKKK